VIGAIFWNSGYFLQFFPTRHTLTSTNDWMKQRDTTFIELPSDAERLTKRPQTNKISDKDRVATHSAPLDPNELKRIIEASRRGAQAPAQAPQPPQQMAQNNPGSQASTAPRPDPTPQPQVAEVKPAPEGPKVLFGGSVSASTAVEQAARAAAANRGGYAGDGGTSFTQGRQGGAASSLDVLSDTMGVDFGPYLARVKHDVQLNWYDLVPESARSPLFKQGKVAIQFAILKDGRVSAMQLAGSSNDVALDRAAWGGINGSNPFPPLPSDFKGDYLLLRFTFFYNPPNGVGIP
jgi:TonB family protein